MIIILASVSILTAYSATTTSKSVPSNGKITTTTGLGIYKDSKCTQTLSAIDWGNITAGNTATYTIYVKNTGTTKQNLTIATNNWTPTAAAQYLSITWNRNNTTLTSNQVVSASLNLTVSADIDSSITTFSNNIIITGTT
jgi:hypothetical protein